MANLKRRANAKYSIAVVLAPRPGSSLRLCSETPKQFLELAGKMVLEHTLDVFERHRRIDEMIVEVSADNRLLTRAILSKGSYSKVSRIVIGGATRQDSPAAGITSVVGEAHKVLAGEKRKGRKGVGKGIKDILRHGCSRQRFPCLHMLSLACNQALRKFLIGTSKNSRISSFRRRPESIFSFETIR